MSKILEKIHSNGSNPSIGDNPLTEDELDQIVEDSFPASDPPSHTPTTSLGGPTHEVDEAVEGRPWRSMWAIAAGGIVFCAVVVAIARKVRA